MPKREASSTNSQLNISLFGDDIYERLVISLNIAKLADINPMFTPLPSECKKRVLCYYRNPTDRIQVARILDVPNWSFERVVFPKQRLCFEATLDAHLEIHTGALDRTTVLETSLARGNECCGHFCKIPCRLLQVEEDMDYACALLAKSKREMLEENYTSAISGKRSRDLAG